MNMAGVRQRKANTANPNANHDALMDPSLSESERHAALRNGTYVGEDLGGQPSKVSRG